MNNPIIISIGGGKGGIGKSTVTTNIGAMLSQKGRRVTFIDADLGGANLHLCLGVKHPQRGLQDWMAGTYSALNDVALETVIPQSRLICGASDILELANPNFQQKQKIISNLKKLDTDYLLVDLGAGSDSHVTDFYTAFSYGIVVMDSLQTSIENAYGFLKNGTLRGLMRLFAGNKELQSRIRSFSDPNSNRPFATIEELLASVGNEYPEETRQMRQWLHNRKNLLIINMVRSSDDVTIGQKFTDIVKKYLSLSLQYIGYVVFDPEIRTSIREMRPAVMSNNNQKLIDCFEAITRNIIALTGSRPHGVS